MIKYYCDKCGVELGEYDFNKTSMIQFVSQENGSIHYEYMLCDKCNAKFLTKLKELRLQFKGEYHSCTEEDDYID